MFEGSRNCGVATVRWRTTTERPISAEDGDRFVAWAESTGKYEQVGVQTRYSPPEPPISGDEFAHGRASNNAYKKRSLRWASR